MVRRRSPKCSRPKAGALPFAGLAEQLFKERGEQRYDYQGSPTHPLPHLSSVHRILFRHDADLQILEALRGIQRSGEGERIAYAIRPA